ncbi:MAG TPA: hypothetical protein VKC61_18290 [Pyrinomonadaceae bacterium]|nr:hypothetical protein [Pyrinomonadaceae bacterium]
MKRLLITLAMTFVLSVSALAGDIPCGAPSPVPNGTTQTTDATLPGEIPCGFAEQISETALSALLTVIGLVA